MFIHFYWVGDTECSCEILTVTNGRHGVLLPGLAGAPCVARQVGDASRLKKHWRAWLKGGCWDRLPKLSVPCSGSSSLAVSCLKCSCLHSLFFAGGHVQLGGGERDGPHAQLHPHFLQQPTPELGRPLGAHLGHDGAGALMWLRV